MFGRLLDVLIGCLTLGFAAISLMSGWGLLWALAFAALGSFEIYLGMRRPPEVTWYERRRRRRQRAQIAKLNARNQERELRQLLGETLPPVPPIQRWPHAGAIMLALVAVVIVGVLVIAALHGFTPSGG